MSFFVIGVDTIQPYRGGGNPPQSKKVRQTSKGSNIHEFEEELVSAMDHPQPGRIPKAYQQQSPSSHKDRRIAVFAFQIMTSPVLSLTPDSSLEEAWELFKERRFRHVPITSDERVVGIVSDRDLLFEAAKSMNGQASSHQEGSHPETVMDLMKTEVLVASPDTEIRQIAKTMFEERIGSMPIVEKQSRLVGIITRSDILRTLVNQAPLELWI